MARVEIDKRLSDPKRQSHAQRAGCRNDRIKVLAENSQSRHSTRQSHANDDRSGLLCVNLANPVRLHLNILVSNWSRFGWHWDDAGIPNVIWVVKVVLQHWSRSVDELGDQLGVPSGVYVVSLNCCLSCQPFSHFFRRYLGFAPEPVQQFSTSHLDSSRGTVKQWPKTTPTPNAKPSEC